MIGRNVAVVIVSCPSRLFVSRGHYRTTHQHETLHWDENVRIVVIFNAADFVSRRRLWLRKKILKNHHVVKKIPSIYFSMYLLLKKKCFSNFSVVSNFTLRLPSNRKNFNYNIYVYIGIYIQVYVLYMYIIYILYYNIINYSNTVGTTA